MSLLEEYREANKKFNAMIAARDYDSSNVFRHEVIALQNQFENPFKVGDKVEYFNDKRWLPTTITKVVSNGHVECKQLIAPMYHFRFPGELPPMTEGQMKLF